MSDDLTKSLEHATGAAQELTGVFAKFAGPIAEELGLFWRDKLRIYRARNLAKEFLKATKMLEAVGLQPAPIPPRLLLPAMEAASAEDDEYLQDRWAALLANATGTTGADVFPSFVEVLKQLTPKEALLIDRIYERAINQPKLNFAMQLTNDRPEPADRGVGIGGFGAIRIIATVGNPSTMPDITEELMVQVADLVRLGLLERMPWYPTSGPLQGRRLQQHPFSPTPGDSEYFITFFTIAFIRACRPPDPVMFH